MKDNIIGKYYKRESSAGEYFAYKITGFDGRYYVAIQYYFSIGYSARDNHHLLQKTFIKSPYFTEISELDFSLAKSLFESGGRFECENEKHWRKI